MLWKIYFWFYLIITAIGLIFLLTGISNLSLGDWISTLNSLILVLGLSIYVFKKKEFYKYKNLFAVNLILLVLFSIDYFIFSEGILGSIHPSLRSNLGLSRFDAVVGVILSLPAIYGNLKLVLNKK